MARFILRRLLLGVVTLWVVSSLIFFGVAALPGDIATEILGQAASPEALDAFRRELGLDQPILYRYVAWLGELLHGDLGVSLANGREIGSLIGGRLVNTLQLAAVAAVIAVPLAVGLVLVSWDSPVVVPLAVGLGIAAALTQGSWFDRGVNLVTLTSISFPEFFIAYVLIVVFSVKLAWLPSLSQLPYDVSIFERIEVMLLPALTLTLAVQAHIMRMTRAALLGVLNSPYIEMAQLKGVHPHRIVLRHALPNALAPIINVVVLNLAWLIVGVVVVEVVFVYPGMGQLMVDSVQKRDLPVVQACSLFFAASYVLLNLTADILSTLTNPRLRHRQ